MKIRKTMQKENLNTFALYACLPFVKLAHESAVEMGPILFLPSSKTQELLSKEENFYFNDYIESICGIKTGHLDNPTCLMGSVKLERQHLTYLLIHEEVPLELRKHALIDSLYLLYFACTFSKLYYGHKIPSFNAFRKIIPCSNEFTRDKSNWENLYIQDNDREETVFLDIIDTEILKGLGKALGEVYLLPRSDDKKREVYRRLIRSVRYLVDRFVHPFRNLFVKGLYFSEEVFEPEEVMLLAASFEVLFNIDDKQPVSDFKHKLRPLLHLKFSRPVEMFWKWVDDFYLIKKRLLHGEVFLDPIFRSNPNFEISHVFLGIKLFVYSFYYHLFKLNLIDSGQIALHNPPGFNSIHPDEVLLFFWTESSLLHKLKILARQMDQEHKEEVLADISFLTNLFVAVYQRYYSEPQQDGQERVKFKPTPIEEIKSLGDPLLEEFEHKIRIDPAFLKALHPQFIQVLHKRLQKKS